MIPFNIANSGCLRSCANISLKLLKATSTCGISLLRFFFFTYIANRFGWFWECPNGGEKCQYRHALPAGFVLKAQKKAEADAAKANVISLEEFLEVEVLSLDPYSYTLPELIHYATSAT